MGRVRLTARLRALPRLTRARLGTLAGGACGAAGAGLQWGTAVGLMVAGVLLLGFFLVLYETDEPKGARR